MTRATEDSCRAPTSKHVDGAMPIRAAIWTAEGGLDTAQGGPLLGPDGGPAKAAGKASADDDTDVERDAATTQRVGPGRRCRPGRQHLDADQQDDDRRRPLSVLRCCACPVA